MPPREFWPWLLLALQVVALALLFRPWLGKPTTIPRRTIRAVGDSASFPGAARLGARVLVITEADGNRVASSSPTGRSSVPPSQTASYGDRLAFRWRV